MTAGVTEAEAHLPPADQDQNRPRCQVPLLGFIYKAKWSKDKNKVRKGIVFYSRINAASEGYLDVERVAIKC